MHKSHKAKKLEGKGGGMAGKIAVQGTLERGGHIRARVMDNNQRQNVVPAVKRMWKQVQAFTPIT
jgi:hypothetical protein